MCDRRRPLYRAHPPATPTLFSGTRIQVLPSRHIVANQQPWDSTYALRPQVSCHCTGTATCAHVLMQLQEFFDARLKRKTDAVTGRVSKFAAENNRLWSSDLAKQMADSMGARLQPPLATTLHHGLTRVYFPHQFPSDCPTASSLQPTARGLPARAAPSPHPPPPPATAPSAARRHHLLSGACLLRPPTRAHHPSNA